MCGDEMKRDLSRDFYNPRVADVIFADGDRSDNSFPKSVNYALRQCNADNRVLLIAAKR
jgi:hypothetical protein